MGRLFLEYIDIDDTNIIMCRFCNVHLLNKDNIKPIIGLEISISTKIPINVHVSPAEQSYVAYNPNNYKFNDIVCSKCKNDVGWTIDYSTSNGEKSFVFLLNESIKSGKNN